MKTAGIFIFITVAVVFVNSAPEKYAPISDPGCQDPSECRHSETCHQNKCVNACGLRNSNVLGNKCGLNAVCMTWESHSAVCGCQPDHIGNPDVECVKVNHEEYRADLHKRNGH